ncbi:MAG: hypothetical protein IPN38_01805 [Flavobacteriales bacterium]|nr:hypothetical protein [Flavobacteriales bacterium]
MFLRSLPSALLRPLTPAAQDSAERLRRLNVTDVGRPHPPGSALYDNTYNAVWGYHRDGQEYAIIGSTMGTHIIDVTAPYHLERSPSSPVRCKGATSCTANTRPTRTASTP